MFHLFFVFLRKDRKSLLHLEVAGNQSSYKSELIFGESAVTGPEGGKKKKTSGRAEIILNGRMARPICKRGGKKRGAIKLVQFPDDDLPLE